MCSMSVIYNEINTLLHNKFPTDHLVLQVFSYTADKEIRTDDLCLDVSRLNGPVVMLKCHHMKGNQMFEYDAEVHDQFA